MIPPVSEKCVGNIIWFSSLIADKKEMEMQDLVCKIKEGLSRFVMFIRKNLDGKRRTVFHSFQIV